MKPLVSVLTPCYNSVRTLPMALASLIAQTHENWECVLVDDGSTDDPQAVVTASGDQRIRYIRLPRNLGRGAARQVALEAARGEFIAMLDADDWIYPGKIARQVGVMTGLPDLAILSAGLAALGPDGDIAGVRGFPPDPKSGLVREPRRGLSLPPLPFAASMVRTEIAKRLPFRADFPTSEDLEFLLRLVSACPWGVLPEVLYAYSELGSVTVAKVAASLRVNRRIFLERRSEFPVSSRARALGEGAKAAAYRLAATAGLWDRVIGRRARKPTRQECTAFIEARAEVDRVVRDRFGSALVEASAVWAAPSSISCCPR